LKQILCYSEGGPRHRWWCTQTMGAETVDIVGRPRGRLGGKEGVAGSAREPSPPLTRSPQCLAVTTQSTIISFAQPFLKADLYHQTRDRPLFLANVPKRHFVIFAAFRQFDRIFMSNSRKATLVRGRNSHTKGIRHRS
jgi:hypothetical protein